MEFLLFVPVLMFSIVVHEVAHAWQARREGDPTAERLGRITLNPIRHLDPLGSVIVPLMLWFSQSGMMLGWAKPVPVDPSNYRERRAGDIRVSLAGIVSNLILAVLFTLLASLLVVIGDGVAVRAILRMCNWGIFINLLLAFFNLIPIPPLDGSHVLYQLLPPRAAELYRSAGRFGFIAILVLVFLFQGLLQLLLTPVFILMDTANWFIRLWI